jgi:hypothetical protein
MTSKNTPAPDPAVKPKRRTFSPEYNANSIDSSLLSWARDALGIVVEIVKRTDDVKGFRVLPRRWVAERTFGWLVRNRRLARDYERLTATSEAMIKVAMIRLMLTRLARQSPRWSHRPA